MAALEYGKYILVSRPRQDQLQRWLPYASIAWLDGKEWRYHQFLDLDKTFDTEQEALAFGFGVARAWIDKER